jgi:hypothetical protein
VKALAIALATSLVPAVAAAAEPACDREPCAPYAYRQLARTLIGFGGAPGLSSASATLTAEIGGRPFSGRPPNIGAFSTGVGFSSTTDLEGRFSVVALGIFVKMDLTSLFLSGFGSVYPPSRFPVRLQAGGRLAFSVSDSFRNAASAPPYVLLRPEMQYFFDVEVPLGKTRTYSLLARGAIDTSVNGSDLFRWSALIGLDYGWDK